MHWKYSVLYFNECEASPDPGSGKWDGHQEPSLTTNTENEELIIKVYPNPSENELFVEITGIENIPSKLELWTTHGQKAKVLSLHAGTNKITIAELSVGLYHYVVYVNNEIRQSGKQIIIRK